MERKQKGQDATLVIRASISWNDDLQLQGFLIIHTKRKKSGKLGRKGLLNTNRALDSSSNDRKKTKQT